MSIGIQRCVENNLVVHIYRYDRRSVFVLHRERNTLRQHGGEVEITERSIDSDSHIFEFCAKILVGRWVGKDKKKPDGR